jgi:type I restriction enzyme R subunit
MEPYEMCVSKFNEAVEKLKATAPEVDSVDDLYSEDEKLKFILAFRTLMRLHKKMCHFTEFTWEDLAMEEQTFLDYSTKYQDLKEHIGLEPNKEKASILEDIDFELELIRKDTINVSYILQLLIKLKESKKDKENLKTQIITLINTEVTLRSKRELIERFIQQNLPYLQDTEDIIPAFEQFWDEEQQKQLEKIISDENLSTEKTEKLIEDFLFSEREPRREEVLELINGEKPSLLQRKTTGERILNKIIDFVETFVRGVEG